MTLPPNLSTQPSTKDDRIVLREEILENGLRLAFSEMTNRYFGDYHRVCIEVATELDLDSPLLGQLDAQLHEQARTRYGATLTIRRTLERMGVPTVQVKTVTDELIETFLAEARHYRARPDYPARLLRAELERKASSSLLPKFK